MVRLLKAALMVLCGVSSVHAKTYTLDDLIHSGLENAHQLKLVEEEIAKTDARIKEAYGGAFPTFDLSANYQYAFAQYNPFEGGGGPEDMSMVRALEDSSINEEEEPGAYVVGRGVDRMMEGFSNMTEPEDQTIALNLSVTQPLFAQGKVGLGIKIAKAYGEGLEIKMQEARQDVRGAITKLFYAALLAQEDLDIQQEAVQWAEESHRLSVLRRSLGKASELDTLTSRLNYEKVLIDHQDALGKRRMAFETLRKQTGIPEPIETFSLEGAFPPDGYALSFEEALDRMQRHNKKLKQLDYGERVQELLVKLAKTDVYPMVYCGGSLGKIAQFNTGGPLEWQDDRKIFVGMSLSLSGGRTHHHKVRQAQADLRSLMHTRKEAFDGLELGLKNAYEQLETSRRRWRSSQALIALAQKGYEISKRAYEVGSITLLDLHKSELDLKSARLAFQAAQFDVHSTVVDIRTLIGLW